MGIATVVALKALDCSEACQNTATGYNSSYQKPWAIEICQARDQVSDASVIRFLQNEECRSQPQLLQDVKHVHHHIPLYGIAIPPA